MFSFFFQTQVKHRKIKKKAYANDFSESSRFRPAKIRKTLFDRRGRTGILDLGNLCRWMYVVKGTWRLITITLK